MKIGRLKLIRGMKGGRRGGEERGERGEKELKEKEVKEEVKEEGVRKKYDVIETLSHPPQS